jgi:hypothetical protein
LARLLPNDRVSGSRPDQLGADVEDLEEPELWVCGRVAQTEAIYQVKRLVRMDPNRHSAEGRLQPTGRRLRTRQRLPEFTAVVVFMTLWSQVVWGSCIKNEITISGSSALTDTNLR